MSLVKETTTGANYLEKIGTGADEGAVAAIQFYEKQAGSDGASGNTVFTLTTGVYIPGTNTLLVFVNGQKSELKAGAAAADEYTETNSITVTFGAGLQAADVVEFVVAGSYNITDMLVEDAAYGAGWDGDTTHAPSQNAMYDKIETIVGLQESLTQILYPSVAGGYNDIYKGGWRPFWFNQQWGGAFGGERPYGHDSEHVWFETGYIEHNNPAGLGSAVSTTWRAQAFKVSKALDVEAVWVHMWKFGNPQKNTEPLEIHIASSLDNGAGTTIIANGTANAINGHSMAAAGENWPITSNTDGEWYRCIFAVNPTLAANTTYYLVWKATGADGTNYFRIARQQTTCTYPHGNRWAGDNATPANWTESTTYVLDFLIEATSATQLLQSGGQFDGLLKFIEGNPLDQSQSLVREMKDFWDDQEFTCRIVTEGTLTISKPFLDAMWGFDHDRIVLYVDGSEHLVLKVYESDGTVHTVTGTTDVVAAGVKDIWVHVRSKNDGSDVVEMTLNGAAEGTPVTSASILFDNDFVELGHVHLGGGFPLPPTWDDDQDMSALPSAGIYAYSDEGGAHEAATFSVQNGSLYQNWPTTNTWWNVYTADPLTLNNANGWAVTWKCRIPKGDNTSANTCAAVQIYDGNKRCNIGMHEYYFESTMFAIDFKYQTDLTDKEHVFTVMGKGSDVYVFLDGKLVVDGTGLLTTATGDNKILFGDFDGGADDNAEIIWDYVKYYDGGELFPDVNAFSLSEFAYWSGDKGDLETVLYNAGTPYSVKEYCGIKENYVKEIGWGRSRKGITMDPTATSTAYVLLDDMEAFVITSFERVDILASQTVTNNTAPNAPYNAIFIDGKEGDENFFSPSDNNYFFYVATRMQCTLLAGLHKIEQKWKSPAGQNHSSGIKRKLIIKQEGN